VQLEDLVVQLQVVILVGSLDVNHSLVCLFVEGDVHHLRTSGSNCRDIAQNQRTEVRFKTCSFSAVCVHAEIRGVKSEPLLRPQPAAGIETGMCAPSVLCGY